MGISRLNITKVGVKDFFGNPEKVFITLATIFGLAMIFSMPLFMVPDEAVHFDRAYQIGSGHLLSQTVDGVTGGIVPVIPGSVKTINGLMVPPIPRSQYFRKILSSDKKFVAFPSSATYSPVAYIPQATGIDLGRIFSQSLGSMVIIGRIFNLAAYIFLVWLAIRIARYGKWVYAVAALFPVAIQEAASLSTDVMTIGLAFVSIAFIHSLFLQDKPISNRQYMYIGLLGLGLGLTKQTNIVFLLPILFLPKNIFKSLWGKFGFIVVGAGISIFAAISWYLIMKYQKYELNDAKTLDIGNVNPVEQLKYVVEYPLKFIETLFRTYIFGGFHNPTILPNFYWISMYGFFSLFAYQLPIPFISLGYIILLIAFLYTGSERQKMKPVIKLSIIQTVEFVLAAIAVALALYLVWTPVGATTVDGIQGRYFIPLIPLLIPLFTIVSRWIRISLDKPYRMGMLVSVVSLINLSATILLTLRYFP